MGCARCHNHKYDPIPQRDYYRFTAILQTAYDPYDWMIPASKNPHKLKYPTRHLDVALESERQEVAAHNLPLEKELKGLEAIPGNGCQALSRKTIERATLRFASIGAG